MLLFLIREIDVDFLLDDTTTTIIATAVVAVAASAIRFSAVGAERRTKGRGKFINDCLQPIYQHCEGGQHKYGH